MLSGDKTRILEQGDYVGRPSSSVIQDFGPNIRGKGIIALTFDETIDHSLHLLSGDHIAQTTVELGNPAVEAVLHDVGHGFYAAGDRVGEPQR